jgi:lysophospholipase L1-like esterase
MINFFLNKKESEITELIEVAGHDNIVIEGTPVYGSSQYFQAIFTARKQRIRQNGNIKRVEFYLTDKPSRLTSFKIYILRKPSVAYTTNTIHSIELINKISAGLNIIDLDTPLSTLEGDFIGLSYEATGTGNNFMLTASSHIGTIFSTVSGIVSSPKTWGGASVSVLNHFPIKVFMQPPIIVGTGDSIICGFNQHNGYIVDLTWDTDYKYSSILYKLSDLLGGISYQNNAVGNTTSNEIESWFDDDVIAMNPRIALIMVGVNDAAIAVLLNTYITKLTSMINKCKQANILPIVGQILPWTNGNNTQHALREQYNATIITLCAGENIGTFNCNNELGQYRTGGASGNLWDFKPGMSDDGTHLTELGKDQVASVLNSYLRTNYSQVIY